MATKKGKPRSARGLKEYDLCSLPEGTPIDDNLVVGSKGYVVRAWRRRAGITQAQNRSKAKAAAKTSSPTTPPGGSQPDPVKQAIEETRAMAMVVPTDEGDSNVTTRTNAVGNGACGGLLGTS